jgi:uncharacterized protein YjbI with pentapeptide repeats
LNIQEVLRLHKQWLAQEEGGCYADLRNAILCNADLSNADLRNAILCNADLSNADLRNANLCDADLSNADLRNANLHYADLHNAILYDTGLSNANLRNANLHYADLHNAILYDTGLSNANLRNANLCDADLSNADLRNANLCNANLRYADLRNANLRNANLRNADLRNANLCDADLYDADLHNADLSNAKNIKNQNSADYIMARFDKTGDGIIAYKTFNNYQQINPRWVIEEGSIIEENVNYNRTNECGCGVNVATLDWVKANGCQGKDIWECLIKWEWLSDVVVPYCTDGKIRAGRVQLIKIIGVV